MLAPEAQQALISWEPANSHNHHSKIHQQEQKPSKASYSAMLQTLMQKRKGKITSTSNPGSERQKRSQGRGHTDVLLQRQDRSRQHRL
jgi:hypothetical protein